MSTQNPFNQAQQVVRAFKEDESLLARLKSDSDPLSVLQETANTVEQASWQGDRVLFRVAVGVLGALALIAALGSIVLVAVGKDTPEFLVSIGSAAVGALVGLFAPSPTSK